MHCKAKAHKPRTFQLDSREESSLEFIGTCLCVQKWTVLLRGRREDRRENQRNEDSGSDLWGMCGRFSGNMGVCELFGVEEEAEGCQTKENGPG